MTEEQRLFLGCVVIPAVMGLGAGGVCRVLLRKGEVLQQMFCAMVVVGALFFVYWWARGWPSFPPVRALQWLFPVEVVALFATFVGLLFRWLRWYATVVAVAFVVVTQFFPGGKWLPDVSALWVALLCALGWGISTRMVESISPAWLSLLVLSGIFGSLAVVLLLTKSLLLAQLSGGFACALLGLGVSRHAVQKWTLIPIVCTGVFLCVHAFVYSGMQWVELLLMAFFGLPMLLGRVSKRFLSSVPLSYQRAGCAVLAPMVALGYVFLREKPWKSDLYSVDPQSVHLLFSKAFQNPAWTVQADEIH